MSFLSACTASGASSPIIVDERFFLTSNGPAAKQVHDYTCGSATPTSDGPRWLEGDLTKTQISWSQIKNMPYVPTPLLYGKFLHVTNDEGIYNCLEPLTGKTKKATRLGASTYSSPIGVADRIYMFDDEGNCTVIKNNDQFEVLAKNGLGERVQTLPAFSDGSMIVRSAEHLWCIEERESSTTQN